jgi:two-component system OmpR family response regulator
MKILIVEDDEETAEYIAAGLAAGGHEATVAKEGRKGFELATEGCFDAIVLDRMLPDLDGLSVLTLIRSEGLSTPVLFLTNLSRSTTGLTDWRPVGTIISSSLLHSRN